MDRRSTLKLFGGGATLLALGACAATQDPDIVDVAAGSPDFTTLVAALQAVGADAILRGPGPFTVFAPTNAAFERLPAGTVENLLLPENADTLRSILHYHIVPGTRVTSSDISGNRRLYDTYTGGADQAGTLTVDGTRNPGKYGTGMIVNDANIILSDILASNGVIHAIDKVLLP